MSPRALANQHRYEQRRRMGRFGRSFAMLSAVGMSCLTVALLILDQTYRPDSFVIDELKIVGSFENLAPQEIENVVRRSKKGNFFSIELELIKRDIEKLAWVQAADVRRQWPNTLLVDVKEQRPVMRWQDKLWVNSDGEVVDLDYKSVQASQIRLYGQVRDSKLMLLKATRWQNQLESVGIELKSLRLTASQSYSLRAQVSGSSSNFDLMLGSEQVEQRLGRFLKLYETQLRFGVGELKRVDARYPNGLAVDASPIAQAAEQVDLQSAIGNANTIMSPRIGNY